MEPRDSIYGDWNSLARTFPLSGITVRLSLPICSRLFLNTTAIPVVKRIRIFNIFQKSVEDIRSSLRSRQCIM